MPPLTERQIRDALAPRDTGRFGANLYYYDQIDSTNDVARALAEEEAPEGTLVMADTQTAGRGRLGRSWIAPPGTSLLMSILFRPSLPLEWVHRLVMVCGLAVAEAAEAAIGVPVDVKWPNDLLLGGKKFTGLLPESAIIGDKLAWVIVGIGVNVNTVFAPPDPLAETATSLRMVGGREYERASLLGEILANLNRWHTRIYDSALIETWRARCVTLGQRIRVETSGAVIEGLAEELDDSGALWLRDNAGQRRRLFSSEATVLRS